jgi:hypothetical protein
MVKQPGAQQRRVLGEMGQSYEQQAKQAEALQKTAMQDAAKMVASAEAMQPATRGGVTIRKPPPGATTAQTVAGAQEAQKAAGRTTLAGRDFGPPTGRCRAQAQWAGRFWKTQPVPLVRNWQVPG